MTSDYNSPELSYMVDPMGRVRFFGIYSAKVVDINDPLKKNRIKVKVQQSTGQEVSGWARSVQPITNVANHPDHQEHTAAQIAALLTTTATSVTSGGASAGTAHTHSVTIPALTVVAKAGADTLKHPHKTAANTTQLWNDAQEQTPSVAEHTPHRLIPKVGQLVWAMFEAGDPEYPVWIGVQ
jgi:hypothetical protein